MLCISAQSKRQMVRYWYNDNVSECKPGNSLSLLWLATWVQHHAVGCTHQLWLGSLFTALCLQVLSIHSSDSTWRETIRCPIPCLFPSTLFLTCLIYSHHLLHIFLNMFLKLQSWSMSPKMNRKCIIPLYIVSACWESIFDLPGGTSDVAMQK